MSEKTPLAKRAAQFAVLTVGGGVALTFAMAGSASADDVTVQDAEVTNAGAAAANSGGNVAVGNASDNTAANGQGAVGLIASNNGSAENTSNGTASITTGEATATGSQAATSVDQEATGGDGPGLDVAVQDGDVVNAGVAASNSGGNIGVGNASTNVAVNAQGAAGGVASNIGGASNTSDGTASITTGAAKATGNASLTDVDQTADTGDGAGLSLIVQNTDVLNLGAAAANSGGNLGIGNASGNLAINLQGAAGLIASNNGGASNKSDGTATIKTGAATATGNASATDIDQAADAGDGAGLAVIVQNAGVLNLGLAAANSGGNVALGNVSGNLAVNAQGALGLIASNVGGASNDSDGDASITTGNATATGNQSATKVGQDADADPAALAIVFQNAPVVNAGLGVANTGLNAAVANSSLNAAIMAQVSFGLLASNVSDVSNLSDGFAMVLTGTATGTGNQAVTVVEQDT